MFKELEGMFFFHPQVINTTNGMVDLTKPVRLKGTADI